MRAALAAVPALCALAGPAMGVDIDDPAARLERHELANGLVVLLLEDHSTPVVSLQVWVRAGSRDEARYSGIAHLFEHMMFKGSKNLEPELWQRLMPAVLLTFLARVEAMLVESNPGGALLRIHRSARDETCVLMGVREYSPISRGRPESGPSGAVRPPGAGPRRVRPSR